MVNRYTKFQNSLSIILTSLTTNLNVINHNFKAFKSTCSWTPENYG